MTKRRPVEISGWACLPPPHTKNTRVIHYAGQKISNQESLRREAAYIKRGHIWCFKLTNRSVIRRGVGRQRCTVP